LGKQEKGKMMMMMVEGERESHKNEASGFEAGGGGATATSGSGTMPSRAEWTRSSQTQRPSQTQLVVGFGEHKIQRKKRMARQRRSSVTLLPFAASSHVPPLSVPARVSSLSLLSLSSSTLCWEVGVLS